MKITLSKAAFPGFLFVALAVFFGTNCVSVSAHEGFSWIKQNQPIIDRGLNRAANNEEAIEKHLRNHQLEIDDLQSQIVALTDLVRGLNDEVSRLMRHTHQK